MQIFVTGGTGFIGSHFLKLAIERGHEVVALRRPTSAPRINLSTEPKWVEGDLESISESAFRGCECLVHFASHGVTETVNAAWADCFRWNVTASLNVWLKAIKAGVRRFVICGSCFEYGKSGELFNYIPVSAPLHPTGAYASSKAAATIAAFGLSASKQLELFVLRPFHVFGEGEAKNRFFPSLRRSGLAGNNFPMTFGKQVRDFIHVDKVTSQFLLACEREDIQAGQPIIKNIGTGNPQTVREFAEHQWKQCQAEGKLQIGAIPYRQNEVMRYVPEI